MKNALPEYRVFVKQLQVQQFSLPYLLLRKLKTCDNLISNRMINSG